MVFGKDAALLKINSSWPKLMVTCLLLADSMPFKKKTQILTHLSNYW
jgi:hypothetical protein